MKLYALFYEKVANYTKKREPYRAQHLALATKYNKEGFLFMGGGLENFEQSALLLFTDKSKAQKFVKEDPYVTNGVIINYTIANWNIAVGSPPPN